MQATSAGGLGSATQSILSGLANSLGGSSQQAAPSQGTGESLETANSCVHGCKARQLACWPLSIVLPRTSQHVARGGSSHLQTKDPAHSTSEWPAATYAASAAISNASMQLVQSEWMEALWVIGLMHLLIVTFILRCRHDRSVAGQCRGDLASHRQQRRGRCGCLQRGRAARAGRGRPGSLHEQPGAQGSPRSHSRPAATIQRRRRGQQAATVVFCQATPWSPPGRPPH